MWQIKNEELKKTVGAFFTDEEIDEQCCQQMPTLALEISLRKNLSRVAGSVAFDISRNEFKLIYNPNGWNPYPEVTPEQGEWLVQDKNGYFSVREFHATYGPEGCDKWWDNDYPEVVAFRALPKPYTGK